MRRNNYLALLALLSSLSLSACGANQVDNSRLVIGMECAYQPFNWTVNKSNEFNVPILLIRFFGMEFILKELEEKSDAVVGWNPHCIVDAIETLVNGEDWIKPCDVEES